MPDVPYGYCHCECGQRTPLARITRRDRGHARGEPLPFVPGHGRRKPERYEVRDCGYETPCWVWLNSRDGAGYGTIRRDGRWVRAYTLFYERRHGSVPVGLQLDHRCRNKPCVNPDHLEPVTPAENKRRAPSTILTMQDAQDIRALAVAGWRGVDIAEAFEVSQQLVCDIKKGRRWVAP